jgi:hypothetical protein
VVIENAAGQLVGVEIKASATVKDSDLRGLKKLASVAGDQFKMGVLLYDGTETMPLGDGLWAAPLSTLWGLTAKDLERYIGSSGGSVSGIHVQASAQRTPAEEHALLKKHGYDVHVSGK